MKVKHICANAVRLVALFMMMSGLAAGARAQEGLTVTGVVTDAAGQPISGVVVSIEGVDQAVRSDQRGRFRIVGVSPGMHTIVARALGKELERQRVTVSTTNTEITLVMGNAAVLLEQIVVIGTREEESRAETAATVGVVTGDVIREVKPGHPSEIMNRVPGVWVNTTGGEGHMAAIRQPLTTNPVYLYLEDGIPTRSTGFFNHNALYEINLPQSERVEVFKGPGTALYGSDAIGATINVSTRAPTPAPAISLGLEGGENTWGRFLLSGSNTFGNHGVRADLNLTRTDGWRQGTEYDRESFTARWDASFGTSSYLKTLITYSNIDQQTAGSSAISRDDFENNPTTNYTPISFRAVRSLRISSALQHETNRSLLSITPYFRRSEMDLLPNWSLTFDPALWETANSSVGLLGRYRIDFEPLRTRVITGFDSDFSPGDRLETRVNPTRQDGIFTDYALEDPLYNYDVRFAAFSPYLHAEASPIPNLRIEAGLRLDLFGYDYQNFLSVVDSGSHQRAADTSLTYSQLSPKVGATYNFAPEIGLFASYRHGFRAPSEGQIFRQGSAANTVGLSAVKANNYEVGVRGRIIDRFTYDISGYYMTKTDDIVGFRNPDGSTETVNAGETLHRGLEVGLGAHGLSGISGSVSYSYARHTYQQWQPQTDVDFSGNDMEFAPRNIGNAVLGYQPIFFTRFQISAEWMRLGSYFENAENTEEYEGHDLLNLRASLSVGRNVSLYGRMMNVTDERYAERASFNAFRGEELAPGLPRTLYLGVQYR